MRSQQWNDLGHGLCFRCLKVLITCLIYFSQPRLLSLLKEFLGECNCIFVQFSWLIDFWLLSYSLATFTLLKVLEIPLKQFLTVLFFRRSSWISLQFPFSGAFNDLFNTHITPNFLDQPYVVDRLDPWRSNLLFFFFFASIAIWDFSSLKFSFISVMCDSLSRFLPNRFPSKVATSLFQKSSWILVSTSNGYWNQYASSVVCSIYHFGYWRSSGYFGIHALSL